MYSDRIKDLLFYKIRALKMNIYKTVQSNLHNLRGYIIQFNKWSFLQCDILVIFQLFLLRNGFCE